LASGESSPRPLVYVDTSVWISALYEAEKSRHIRAKALIEDLRERFVIIVSQLVLNEIVDALKHKALSDHNIRKSLVYHVKRGGRALADPIESHVKRKWAQFGTAFLQLPNVRILSPEFVSLDSLEVVQQILLSSFGHIEMLDFCKTCGAPDFTFLRHIAPYRDDVLHVLVAYQIGCAELFTFDRGFENIGIPPPTQIPEQDRLSRITALLVQRGYRVNDVNEFFSEIPADLKTELLKNSPLVGQMAFVTYHETGETRVLRMNDLTNLRKLCELLNGRKPTTETPKEIKINVVKVKED
jgi:predicted nucleic acid-binding protein